MSPEDIKVIGLKIDQSIAVDKANSLKQQKSRVTPLTDMRDYFQRKYPKESEEEIMTRTLEYMKEQFLNTFPSKKDDSMSTSSQGTMDVLAGESQAEEEATTEDVWDALIMTIVPPQDRGKRIQD